MVGLLKMLDTIIGDGRVLLFTRIFVGIVLLIAALLKFIDRRGFGEAVRDYGILPKRVAGVFAKWLPVIEFATAVGMLLGLFLFLAIPTSLVLFLMFGSAVMVNLVRGRRKISCGCFGAGLDKELNWTLVGRNVVLTCLSGLLWYGYLYMADQAAEVGVEYTIATALSAWACFSVWWLANVILGAVREYNVEMKFLTALVKMNK